MAIARGAGTEIIRGINLEAVNSTARVLIYGVQHHIYTVLSIIVHAWAVDAAGDYIECHLVGYDTVGGASGETIRIFKQDMSAQETYVWNDKFSFMGFEPVDFTAGLDSVAKQDAIADQGQNTAQILRIKTEHADDNVDVICTFIDQNNAQDKT